MDCYDLEDKINGLNSIIDTMNDLSFNVLENSMTDDDIASALHGIAVIIELKINTLFDTYKRVFKLDQYNDYLQ
jgi:hypothetical protein